MLTGKALGTALLSVTVVASIAAPVQASDVMAVRAGAVSAAPADVTDPTDVTGLSPDRAAASCYEIKQLHPDSPDEAYWLLTPEMTAPAQFWCDMSTDGGGWVRIGSGREQWSTTYDGKGDPADLAVANPPLTRSLQLASTSVDALLDADRVDDLGDGIRIKRALDGAGTSWQEVRFNFAQRDRWVWTFGAEHQAGGYDIGGTTGSGGQTNYFGGGTGTSRVDLRIQKNQGYRWGFAYGSSVTGTNSSTTYLWASTNGGGSALPYSEVYLRPKLMSADLVFEPVGDSGSRAIELPDAADNSAQVNPWGVTGTAGSTGSEGNVEVQEFEQIGNVMFVGGNFRYVQRDASGAGRVEQSYLAAFDATTGEYLPGFTPALNEQVRALKALPDGNLAVGGDFTQVNGQTVQGLVAIEPSSGAVVSSWGVSIENGLSPGLVRIETLDVSGDYLYLGGAFTHLSRPDGTGRRYARAAGRVSAATGEPSNWNPEFNGTVVDLSLSEDGSRAYYAGYFGASRSDKAWRAAAVMTDAGATLDPTPWNPVWSSGNDNYQQAIDQVGDNVWVGGSEHSLYNFATSTYDRLGGRITKRGGDFQAMDGEGGLLYAGCHCNNWVYEDAYTWSNVGTGWTQADAIGWFGAWDTDTATYVPQFTPSFSLRLGSGIWAIEIADDGTVWAGGDITTGATTAGGRWLGGFARWAPRDTTAPTAPSNLRAGSETPDTVSLAWNAATGGVTGYQILRDDRVVATTNGGRAVTVPKAGENRFFVRAVDAAGNVSASTAVFATGDGNPAPTPVIDYEPDGLSIDFDASGSTDDGTIERYIWDLGDGTTSEEVTVRHTYEASGTYPVKLTVVDDKGAYRTAQVDVQAEIAVPSDAYGSTVYEDSPYLYWRMGDAGSLMQDYSGHDRAGTVNGTVTRGVAGALVDNPDLAAGFDGSSGHVVGRPGTEVSNPTSYSVEAWFNTKSTRGGKLIGFGNQPSGLSSSYDRHVYLRDDGSLVFGAWTGQQNIVTSTAGLNDGDWHHVVATQGDGGMALYVDGTLTGTNPQSAAQSYTGYWRVGADRTWGGASSSYLEGVIDEAAVYTSVLTPEQAAEHYALGTAETANEEPVAQFLVDAAELSVSVDASASADADGEVASYEWDFGDDASATGVLAEHTYAAAGTYSVTLTVTDDDGATGTATQEVSVAQTANEEPVAQFLVDAAELSVSVDASASADADGEVASYEWDFGDDASATGVLAEHTYAAAGTYSVTLTVTDDDGATGTATQEVSVAATSEPVTATVIERDADWSWYYAAPAPQTDWKANGADLSSWKSGPAPLGFGFSGTATGIDITGPASERPVAAYFVHEFQVDEAARVLSLQLDTVANDGVVVYVNGTEVARHNMRDGDVTHYTFAPTARNVTTANNDPVVVDVPVDLLVDGTNVVTAETHLNYRGTRDVSFELDAELSTVGASSPPPNRQPEASFTTTSDRLTVSVDASSSSDADDDVLTYAWDFGDGQTGSGVVTDHTYATAGTYPVELTVTDGDGAADRISQDVTVVDPGDAVAATVIERDADWSWYFEAAAPQPDWKELGADLSSWSTGGASLGFGFSGVVTDIDIAGPASERPRTAYFAREFEILDAGRVQSLVLDTVANDGVVIYVNGTEVARHNMSDGDVTHFSYAPTARSVSTADADPVVIDVPVELLADGTNVVTAETHLNYRGTRDVSFALDAELTATAG